MNPVIHYIKDSLHGYYPDSEVMPLSKLLLTKHFGMSVIEIYGGKDRSFSEKEWEDLNDILTRLQKYEPIQYIIGMEDFCGLQFQVNRSVLIPRPETQELVYWICKDNPTGELHILDIGTGSGCIPITLAKQLPHAHISSWDISEEALRTAERNCQLNGVKVKLIQKDVLTAETDDKTYDIIVSNPPYITEKEKVQMEANVLNWEPSLALFVPDADPLLFYRRIAELGRNILKESGKLYFEINREYGTETKKMLKELGYHNMELKKDLFGNDRMIKAIR